MIQEQIQSAIDCAKRIIKHAISPDLAEVKLAIALLDVYGRLQEAEKRVPITVEHWRAVVELSAYVVDGPRLINELTGDYVRMRSQSEGSFEAAKQWNAAFEQAHAELTEARKEIESVTEHAKAMENSCDSYREMLDEARRQLDIAKAAFTTLKIMGPSKAIVDFASNALSQITPTETQS